MYDASRCILVIREYEHATAKNTIDVLKEALLVAESGNSVILVINTDRRSQFYTNKKGKGKFQFQIFLEIIGIKHITSWRNNPQTNNKLERLGREHKQTYAITCTPE